MEFIKAPAFTRHLAEYFDDDAYRELQNELALNPESEDLMPGCGGFRKLRWEDERRGKGRRSGLRIIYYYFASDHQIWLMMLYGKNEASDLTQAKKKTLKMAIQAELKARTATRISGTGKTRRKR